MITTYLILLVILLGGMWLSVKLDKLTLAGAIIGGSISCCIFLGAGFTGIVMMAAFFVLGTFATSSNLEMKRNLGVAQENNGRRTAGQVLANAGVAGIIGLLAWQAPANVHLLQLMMAAGIAAATGDTLSSEWGTVYGRRFFNVLNFKKDDRGLNGVISLEGCLFGLGGSTLIAILYAIGFGWHAGTWYVVIAGVTGNLADSVLGAAFERKHLLGNNAVNFLNTCVAALTAWLLYVLYPPGFA